jgi:small subunit ribosomal protein S6
MALSVSSTTTTTLPPFPARLLPSAAPAPRVLRGRVFSTGYAASFYGGAAGTRTRSRDNEEVGDEEGSSSGFGGGLGMSASEAALALEEREMPPCPPGLRQYETMVVLRPDMSEEERLALIQRYEEVIPTETWSPLPLQFEHEFLRKHSVVASPCDILSLESLS